MKKHELLCNLPHRRSTIIYRGVSPGWMWGILEIRPLPDTKKTPHPGGGGVQWHVQTPQAQGQDSESRSFLRHIESTEFPRCTGTYIVPPRAPPAPLLNPSMKYIESLSRHQARSCSTHAKTTQIVTQQYLWETTTQHRLPRNFEANSRESAAINPRQTRLGQQRKDGD